MSADLPNADVDQLGVLVALPLSTSAAVRIRRVLSTGGSKKGSRGSGSARRRGLASPNRGGAASGSSFAAPPLRVVGRIA
jgi:hypothetical protein